MLSIVPQHRPMLCAPSTLPNGSLPPGMPPSSAVHRNAHVSPRKEKVLPKCLQNTKAQSCIRILPKSNGDASRFFDVHLVSCFGTSVIGRLYLVWFRGPIILSNNSSGCAPFVPFLHPSCFRRRNKVLTGVRYPQEDSSEPPMRHARRPGCQSIALRRISRQWWISSQIGSQTTRHVASITQSEPARICRVSCQSGLWNGRQDFLPGVTSRQF